MDLLNSPTDSRDLWSRDRYIATDEIGERVSDRSPHARQGQEVRTGAVFPVQRRRGSSVSSAPSPCITSASPLQPSQAHVRREAETLSFSETEVDVKAGPAGPGAPDREIERLLRLAVEIKRTALRSHRSIRLTT